MHECMFTCMICVFMISIAFPQPLPCGATLIISPQAIVQQWMDEISKHTQPGVISAYVSITGFRAALLIVH